MIITTIATFLECSLCSGIMPSTFRAQPHLTLIKASTEAFVNPVLQMRKWAWREIT